MKTVKIKPEFLNKNEQQIEYKIVEDNGDRLIIRPVVWENGGIIPTELVRKNMTEAA